MYSILLYRCVVFFFLFTHSLSGIKGVTIFGYDDDAFKHICGDMCFQLCGVGI